MSWTKDLLMEVIIVIIMLGWVILEGVASPQLNDFLGGCFGL